MDDLEQDARRRRAARRASWPGTVARLEDLPDVECVDAPPEVLFAMVTQLSLASWAMSGRPLPAYSRADIPGRILRPDGPAHQRAADDSKAAERRR
ncbi:MAG: hypothetical protein H6704_04250 [Myxococcales bacterium]|nr:hypothetical protein [Myxococcales bacterium]MCB9535454.1 hypothetical protein [Myxococcales bacterium]